MVRALISITLLILSSTAALPQNNYTVSGHVTYLNGDAMPGVTVALARNGAGTVTALTGANGSYQFNGLHSHNYTLSAASTACASFTPSQIDYSPITSSHTDADFTATCNPPGLRFIPVPACRVADTRANSGRTGEFGEPALVAGQARKFQITASSNCTVPASAKAYSLNVTAVPPQAALGYISIWPTPAPSADQTPPTTSTINFEGGRVIADAVIVGAGDQGAISVYSSDATELIIDINGYFDSTADASAFWFFPVNPCRVSDTRDGTMPDGYGPPQMSDNETRRYLLPGACSLPLGAAYSLNVTALPDAALNFLDYVSVWPADQATQPTVSTLNSYDGDIMANAAIVPAAAISTTIDGVAISPGMISTFVPQHANLILDTNGYFGLKAEGGLSFYPVLPCRAVDTRNVSAPFLLGQDPGRAFALAGTCGVSLTAKAVVVNATVIPINGFLDYLTLYPTGATTMPVVSTLNSYRGKVVANMAIVPLGAGSVSAFVADNADLILDVLGYFE